ncbi:MAG TPA: helicase C-terminal domain-containing protein, partial [Pseudomonadales bacterium]
NPFWKITVADASTRLIQASGRLIRTETDHGQISLLDSRVVSKSYGKALLDALPPYKRQIDWQS